MTWLSPQLSSLRNPGARVLGLTLTGAAMVGAFAPLDWWPLAPICIAILFIHWQEAIHLRSAFLSGFAFGLGFFLTGVSWVYISLHTYGSMPAGLAVLATLAFCSGLALFVGATGAITALVAPRGLVRLCVAPFVWLLLDWARTLPLNGFPWLALGYSQVDSPLAGFAPLGGVYAVGLVSAICASCLAYLALAVRTRYRLRMHGAATSMPKAEHATQQRTLRIPDAGHPAQPVAQAVGLLPRGSACAALLIGGLCLIGVWSHQHAWTTPVGTGLDVALVQGNVPLEFKFSRGRYEQTLERYAQLIESTHARLVVLPETAIPTLQSAVDSRYWARLRAHAVRTNADLLVGIVTGDFAAGYFNAVVSIGVSPEQVYRKRHLVPFGEYIPLGFQWILSILHIPMSSFTAGPAAAAPLAVAGEQVGLNICYEEAFGSEIIAALPRATLLANVSNMAWFGNSLAPAQHLEMARMLALETGRDILRATNTGATAIVRRDGSTQALPGFVEGILLVHAQGYEGSTPYVMGGDRPCVLFSALLLLAIGIATRVRARKA